MKKLNQVWLPVLLVCFAPMIASAQVVQGGGSFRAQCPTATVRHPGGTSTGGSGTAVTPTPDRAEAAYTGPVSRTATLSPIRDGNGNALPLGSTLMFVDNGGAIKCQQISGGDGYMTEADGNQTFMFSFGPLSGLNDIENGQPGTEFPAVFNNPYCDPAANGASGNYNNGQPNPYCGAGTGNPNGAVGYPVSAPAGSAADIAVNTDVAAIMNTGVMNGSIPGPLMAFDEDDEFLLTLSNVGMIMRPDLFEEHTVHFHGYPNASSFYDGVPDATWAINIGGSATYYYLAPDAGTYFWHCHITPPEHIQMGMEGWLYVRPRQNRVPPLTSLYYAMAGTGTLASHGTFGTATGLSQQSDLRTACFVLRDILCSAPAPAINNGVTQGAYLSNEPLGRTGVQGYTANSNFKYVYNDGDGSTRYDIDVPLNIHGFDPNFHFVGMTFNPEGFADMKDKYFLLNGRSYPDTAGVPAGYLGIASTIWNGGVASNGNHNPLPSNAITTAASDAQNRPSQPAPAIIVLSASGGPPSVCGQLVCGQRAALRINNLDVQEYQTLASIGIPMLMVGFNAKILRDQAGNNLYIKSNSITLGGGESLDVIIDSTGVAPGTYFLYTPQLDHLSNDAENFGGLMTEVVVVP